MKTKVFWTLGSMFVHVKDPLPIGIQTQVEVFLVGGWGGGGRSCS